jgi:hypothetical protein
VLLVCTVYSVLCSEIALSRKPFGIGHMTDTVASQNIDLSSWNTLYKSRNFFFLDTELVLCMLYVANVVTEVGMQLLYNRSAVNSHQS